MVALGVGDLAARALRRSPTSTRTSIGRNKYLQNEIAKLDKQIEEIKKLREQTASLLARKKVVETLQTNRSEAVHLLDQLVRQLPDGVYLKGIKQTGRRASRSTATRSRRRASRRSCATSSPRRTWRTPSLVEIKAVTQLGNQRLNEFTLNVSVDAAEAEERREKGAKPAPKPPAAK